MNIVTTKKISGFTLIELLVVISIIGLLSSVVLASLSGARESARKSAAQAELRSLRTGLEMMVNDTNTWPNGCTIGQISNPEVGLSNQAAGLLERPAVGSGAPGVPNGCSWSQTAVDAWGGPYVNTDELLDPWGRSYQFDPDYIVYRDCSTKPNEGAISALFSEGPTTGGNEENSDGTYDCDDIFIELN